MVLPDCLDTQVLSGIRATKALRGIKALLVSRVPNTGLGITRMGLVAVSATELATLGIDTHRERPREGLFFHFDIREALPYGFKRLKELKVLETTAA